MAESIPDLEALAAALAKFPTDQLRQLVDQRNNPAGSTADSIVVDNEWNPATGFSNESPASASSNPTASSANEGGRPVVSDQSANTRV